MSQQIDTFSIQDLFWVRLRQDINFTVNGLPKEIHFTISNSPNSPDINLHISKNVTGNGRKPSIRIAEIDKILFEELTPLLSLIMANSMFESVNIKLLKKRNPSLFFFSSTKIEKSKGFKNKLIKIFEPISTTKRGIFKIKGNYENLLDTFFRNEFPEDKIKELIGFSYRFSKDANFAAIPKEESSILYRKVNGRWFRIKKELDLIDLLKRFVGSDLANYFVSYVIASIEKLIAATSYDDVETFNNPVRLIKKLN